MSAALYGLINEIYLGYCINNSWFNMTAKRTFDEARKRISPKDFETNTGRARVMAEQVLAYAKKKGYSGKPQVFWTSNGNSLQEAIDKSGNIKVNPKENPTDVLLKFPNGPANGYLGISAKSAINASRVKLKNPSIGTIESDLKLDLLSILKKKETEICKNYNLSAIGTQRKVQLRKNKTLQSKIIQEADDVLTEIRDKLYSTYNKMEGSELATHIISQWINADKVFPPYVKCIGTGNDGNYRAIVENPLKNNNLSKLNTGKIKLTKLGNNSIGISADNSRIMMIRIKFRDEKLASPLKFSGESW